MLVVRREAFIERVDDEYERPKELLILHRLDDVIEELMFDGCHLSRTRVLVESFHDRAPQPIVQARKAESKGSPYNRWIPLVLPSGDSCTKVRLREVPDESSRDVVVPSDGWPSHFRTTTQP